MSVYKTFAEAAIAYGTVNKIYTDGERFFSVDDWPDDGSFSLAKPFDHFMTIDEFFDGYHKFVYGDYYSDVNGLVTQVKGEFGVENSNVPDSNDYKRLVIKSKALDELNSKHGEKMSVLTKTFVGFDDSASAFAAAKGDEKVWCLIGGECNFFTVSVNEPSNAPEEAYWAPIAPPLNPDEIPKPTKIQDCQQPVPECDQDATEEVSDWVPDNSTWCKARISNGDWEDIFYLAVNDKGHHSFLKGNNYHAVSAFFVDFRQKRTPEEIRKDAIERGAYAAYCETLRKEAMDHYVTPLKFEEFLTDAYADVEDFKIGFELTEKLIKESL